VLHVARAERMIVLLFPAMLGFGAQRHRAIAKQQAFAAILVDEMLVDGLRARWAADWIHEDFVPNLTNPEQVRHHVFGDAALLIRSNAAFQDNRASLDANHQIVDVDGVVRRQVLPDEITQLGVAQVVEVVEVFEIARHGSLAFTVFLGTKRVR
jgi:hypothetical protein